jgi:hypothetical protein
MHWLKLSAGLLERKHREKIGPALWEFLWLVSKQYPGGAVCQGEPIAASRIASDLGTAIATVRRGLNRLEREQYIRCEAVSGRGNRYFIVKDKRFGLADSQESASSPKPLKSETDPRQYAIAEKIKQCWLEANPGETKAPWDAREAGALSQFLKGHKESTRETLLGCVTHRFQSDANHCERPGVWISKLDSYRLGPLDKFKQQKNGTNGKPHQPMVDLMDVSRKVGIVP